REAAQEREKQLCKGWEDAIEDARLEEREAAQEREKQLCKGWEDAIEDARLEERETAQEREKQVRQEERESAKSMIISNAIGIYREMNVPETEILQRIMLRYTLTERAANTYLLSAGV
ncbi:MAG: hypothetical protein LUG61_07155, partial [Lachnospiraceae bacterium]|nr:hypothetical protein [Lachnospiraceae bacterium]